MRLLCTGTCAKLASMLYSGTLYLASDHGGFELKEFLQDKLSAEGCKVVDLGPHEMNPIDDYPDYVFPAADEVAKNHHARAIVIGRTGQGEAMCANRVKHVRAALYYGGSIDIVRKAREHENVNVLSLGADFATQDEAWEAVHIFLKTPFPGEDRHVRRIHKLDE